MHHPKLGGQQVTLSSIHESPLVPRRGFNCSACDVMPRSAGDGWRKERLNTFGRLEQRILNRLQNGQRHTVQ